MHETLSNNFKGWIDNLYVDNGNLRISGWLANLNATSDEVSFHLDIGRPITFYSTNERQDVFDFYINDNNKAFLNSGFDISIPNPDKKDLQVYALVRGQKEVIFNISVETDTRHTIESSHVNETVQINIRKSIVPDIVVVDNFYENPYEVRDIALAQSFDPDLRYHKGKRTQKRFLPQGIKQTFEALLGTRITNWANYEYNGVFQYCTAEDALVYHCDVQRYAGAIYLTPDAPLSTGTSMYRSREYPDVYKINTKDDNYKDVFKGGYYDKTKFEKIDDIGNVFNRLVLWNAQYIHSASEYFGQTKEDSRLFHLFFFDIEE